LAINGSINKSGYTNIYTTMITLIRRYEYAGLAGKRAPKSNRMTFYLMKKNNKRGGVR
jgi:hypothetical protein